MTSKSSPSTEIRPDTNGCTAAILTFALLTARATRQIRAFSLCHQGLRARDDRTLRPWRIDAVYLFDAQARLAQQRGRGVKTGVAAGVQAEQWEAAEIHPAQTCEALVLSDQQREQLRLFSD
ncbi:hypothetical protein [Nocardioides iriomotensis]|uniref:hypothetical protein n=1 Tax=Nocardioides iriomotensis TaxID=715784 RepID=UPI0013EABD75|nr:hypothetical protein [Nocardioides iriomotensis]